MVLLFKRKFNNITYLKVKYNIIIIIILAYASSIVECRPPVKMRELGPSILGLRKFTYIIISSQVCASFSHDVFLHVPSESLSISIILSLFFIETVKNVISPKYVKLSYRGKRLFPELKI